MNPSDITGDPGSLNRPSVFTEMYPPTGNRIPFDWDAVPGRSQDSLGDVSNSHNHQNPGFNMQAPLGSNWPNFQFSNNHHQLLGHTVQFPLRYTHNQKKWEFQESFRCKRKTDSPPLQVAKQFITEEKMSEHLSKLHISSETPTSEMESEQVKEQRLYMCEEMKKFHVQTESILPESLLVSINRPCTALVLWKPPESILAPSIFNQDREEESENNNNNNNNESARDFNPPVAPPLNDMEFEDL